MMEHSIERGLALELAEEVDEVVDQLWAAGQTTFVLRLMLEDCERLLKAVRGVPGAEDEAATLELLCQTASTLGTPVLKRELTPAHRELLNRLGVSRRRCLACLVGPKAGAKRRRAFAAVPVLGLLLAVAYQLLHNQTTAAASATYSPDYSASMVLDNLTKTEWLLPQEKTGWIELSFSRPRRIEALRIRNSSNGSYRDRATKSFKLEAFKNARVVATAQGEFRPIAKDTGPLEIRLDAREVTHVRITIDSFYGAGGGLAEVEIR